MEPGTPTASQDDIVLVCGTANDLVQSIKDRTEVRRDFCYG